MNLPDPAVSRPRPWLRGRGADAGADIDKTGDLDQQDNKVAIAHTGIGDIILSPPGGPMAAASASSALSETAPPSAVVRRRLPDDARELTGRDGEVRAVVRAIGRAAETGGPVVICAIDGMAGVGKTSLAVHAARRVSPQFPDGQWFMRLHAHTPGHEPVQPAAALTALLSAAGLDPSEIPDDLEAKEEKWQERTAGQRILLLFDDAASRSQVQPLLPAGGNAVLVTSRHRIEAFEGLELDVLPTGQAVDLFARLSGRVDSEPGATTELVTLAGRLPLAIGLLAGRLRHRPAWTVADLASELAATRDRSATIGAADQPVSAAFDLSYSHLSPGRQQFFRRLGLHPGTDVDVYAAAALTGLDLDQARRELDELYADHLIDEPARGRYRFHDLLSDYARTLAATDRAEERAAAVGRLFDYYLHTAQAASRYLARYPLIDLPAVAALPLHAPEVLTTAHAATWMDAELANLRAVTEPRYAITIAAAMADFLLTTGRWDEAANLHHTALNSARRMGDVLGEATALTSLARVQRVRYEYAAATASSTRAVDMFHGIGQPAR